MRKQTTSKILLARFVPNYSALAEMKIATLKMPYREPIMAFSRWLNTAMGSKDVFTEDGQKVWVGIPYRFLNSALLACAPTIAHGFEPYEIKKPVEKAEKGHRMMVIAKADAPLAYPSVQQIAVVMRQWMRVWYDSSPWLQNVINLEGKKAWADLLTSLDAEPDTNWDTSCNLHSIFTQSDDSGISAFELMPNLLATLLHETTSRIQGQSVKWRRMQETDTRLCLLSEPINIEVSRKSKTQKSEKFHPSSFCYKVEFFLHNQTSRNLPWVYIKPHCTRLVHKPLGFNQRGNGLNILVGANKFRLTGWTTDTTLIRLKASRNPQNSTWLDPLPKLLQRIKARDLKSPVEICEKPQDLWKKPNESRAEDEYYIPHVEGYKYKKSGKHPVPTGLPLVETAEIIGSLTGGFLKDVLEADDAIVPDAMPFESTNVPEFLTDIEQIRKLPGLLTEAQCRKQGITLDEAKVAQLSRWQTIISKSVERALRGKKLIIACFYNSPDTLDWMEHAIGHHMLLARDGQSVPDNVTILPVPIPSSNADLVQPFSKSEESSSSYPEQKAWREQLLLRWCNFIEAELAQYTEDCNVSVSAIVELDSLHDKNKYTIAGTSSAHSVIREAFARNNIRVQMMLPIGKPRTNVSVKDMDAIGLMRNVVSEVIIRQLGTVFAPPVSFYNGLGFDNFSKSISQELDVIAFSFRSSHSGICYCLATRLRADGTIDVMLPGENMEYWMPYADAVPKLGEIFGKARKSLRSSKIGDCPIRLKSNVPVNFVEQVLTKHLDKPTIAIVEADNWRQCGLGKGGWWQLGNSQLAIKQDVLSFANYKTYTHDDVPNLLAVVRLRTGEETPAYVTNRDDWNFDFTKHMTDYKESQGFIDPGTDMFHYLSVNGLARTNKGQPQHQGVENPVVYRIQNSGAAFKHAPVIEMVPFFVAQPFNSLEGKTAVCRMVHHLRFHPGWIMGEINSPYIMHLGDTLIKDQETILGLD